MSYGQPCSRTTAGPSVRTASTYPTFSSPASIWLTVRHDAAGAAVIGISRPDRGRRDRRQRLEDHFGHGLRLRDHGHVRAVDLGDLAPRPFRHRTDDLGARRLVAGGDNRPGREWSPRGWPIRL